MAPVRRKCKFSSELQILYPSFKQGKDDYLVMCLVCDSTLSIANKGRLDIEKHLAIEKHKKNNQSKQLVKIDKFVVKEKNYDLKQARAAEATLSYHVVKHQQSYKSTDCRVTISILCNVGLRL